MLKEFFSNDSPTPVDDQIKEVLTNMEEAGVYSEEYQKLMTLLERLTEVKAKSRRPPVSRDTVALIAGSIIEILVIVAYERTHVMTSQGFKRVIRPR